MREILFRGKTKRNEWIYGDLITHWIDFDDAIKQHHTREIWDIKPETVGQYTGLTDKNGKKIFEGDIVKENDIYHKGELQIKGNTWRVAFADGLFFGNFKNISVYLQSLDGMEVIGNVHDNPELLEVQNEKI